MSDKNFDARSSAAVIVSNSQFFSTSIIRFHASAADSPCSLFRSKKSALLCCTFLSGVKCKRNSVYSLCNGSELGSLSLTVFNAMFPIRYSFTFHSATENTVRVTIKSDLRRKTGTKHPETFEIKIFQLTFI